MLRTFLLRAAVVIAAGANATLAGAQAVSPATSGDSLAKVTFNVKRDSSGLPLESVLVRGTGQQARTDAQGTAVLRIPAGSQTIRIIKLGFAPDSVLLIARAGMDTSFTISLNARPADVEAIMVTSTRTERRVEDTPLRVEVIDEEEVAEKVAMSPGDIAMMLNETSGLRVQATNPSLGGANVRIQGLRGRYSLILADGLPLYGGQSGGLSLLQIPPVDLGSVEIIKGSASALYGSSALGGVIDLISRRPGEESEKTLLLNQTSRGGTDASFFATGHASERVGATLLANASRQSRNDIDKDGWTDMPGYNRYGIRPRLFFNDESGNSALVTGSFTAEDRNGGTIGNATSPIGTGYVESLNTKRFDFGAIGKRVVPEDGALLGINALHGSILTLRTSAVQQRHDHQFGTVTEKDRHNTTFGELSIAVPRGAITYLVGGALQYENYRSENVSDFDYSFRVPSLFARADIDARSWLSLSANARLDAHSKYGTFVNPRLSVLFRPADKWWDGWNVRLSAGTGAFAPTPLVEETEVTGLTPLANFRELVAERASSGSLDIGGPVQLGIGELQLNGTAFGSQVRRPLQVFPFTGFTDTGVQRIAMANAWGSTNTWGTELLARLTRPLSDDDESPVFRATSTYTFMHSTECSGPPYSALCNRDDVPLTPKHSASVVTTVEQEDVGRVGLEFYYTGRQRLEDNPYRSESRPYLIMGLMGERIFNTRVGKARVFLNFENLTNVRQTRFDPLVLPQRAAGGRWTTDAWTDLTGFTVNGGVRFSW